MESCLGIYIGEKTIKYSKLIRDEKTDRISLDSYGTKYVSNSDELVIDDIINQTGSTNTPICINLKEYNTIQRDILKQLSKSDIRSIVEIEVSDYAATSNLNEKVLDHREIFMDSSTSSDNYVATIAIADKSNIQSLREKGIFKNLVGLYPKEFLLKNIVQNNSNYLIIDIDEKTRLISVVGEKIAKIVDIDVSMSEILNRIAQTEGSFEKAVELCKSINVLSDNEEITENVEKIIEPIIQDILNRISAKLDESRINYEKLYLTGLINLFINIDVLFEQFFGISTEKLKPFFLKTSETTLNMAEVIEANDAISLAYEGLVKQNLKFNFLASPDGKNNIFKKSNVTGKDAKASTTSKEKTGDVRTIIENGLIFANLVAGVGFIGYAGFSAAYSSQMEHISNELSRNINSLKLLTSNVQNDTSYISTELNKYKTFNDFIATTIQKINEGKIGNYTTYNVANFMQRIAKFIPSDVELQTITSNDNKHVTIVACAYKYSELGYFVSELKLRGILTNIKVDAVQTKRDIKIERENFATVTIGGDLP